MTPRGRWGALVVRLLLAPMGFVVLLPSGAAAIAPFVYDAPISIYDEAITDASNGNQGSVLSEVVVTTDSWSFPPASGTELGNRIQQIAPRALPVSSLPSPADAADLIRSATPVGSALKNDAFHRAAVFGIDDVATNGSVFRHIGGDGVERTLIQVPAAVDGIPGRFEYLIDDALNLTHQEFIKGGSINGLVQTP